MIELAPLDAAHERGAFDEVVAAHRKETAFRGAAMPVTGAADPLKKRRHGMRRAELAYQVDLADVDSELERCGGYHCAELTRLQTPFGVEPVLSCQAAVMRGDRIFANELAQMPRDALRQTPRVDEDQSGPMRHNQRGELCVDLLPHFEGHDGFERRTGELDGKVHLALMPDIDDPAAGCRIPVGVVPTGANQEVSHVFDRVLRGGEPNPGDVPPDQRLEPLQ